MISRRGLTTLATLFLCLLASCSDDGTEPGFRIVDLETNLGTIRLELDPDHAPITVANFLRYATEGYYQGTIFHRVMPSFVIQGGGFTDGMIVRPPTHPPVRLECPNGLHNVRGAVAMSRTSDPNSATTQFFINLEDNLALDYNENVEGANGYAVFAHVIGGMNVVDSISHVPTGQEGQNHNVPVDSVEILRLRFTE